MAARARSTLTTLERAVKSVASLRQAQPAQAAAHLADLQTSLSRHATAFSPALWPAAPPSGAPLPRVSSPLSSLRGLASSALPQPQPQPQAEAHLEADEAPATAAPAPGRAVPLDLEAHPAAALLQWQERPPVYGQESASSQHAHTFKVEATYVGSRINVYDLMARPEFAGHYKRLHKGTVVLGLQDRHVPERCESEGMPLQPYLVASGFGSAVFFGVDQAERDQWMAVLREVATDPVAAEKPYNEEYTMAVSRALPTWSQLEPEMLRLQTLDLRNMQVIAQVLAQSVALDFYSAHVERTLETFCNMNTEMAETANIARINKQHLLQLVAENNIVMTEIISKLGVHERYDIAWKHVQYGRIWEFLRTELEMDPRFKNLDMKLNLIQDNLKYFLEILQARKSDALEWTIIILIGCEICLSLYELGSKVA